MVVKQLCLGVSGHCKRLNAKCNGVSGPCEGVNE